LKGEINLKELIADKGESFLSPLLFKRQISFMKPLLICISFVFSYCQISEVGNEQAFLSLSSACFLETYNINLPK
jgi:hypothetical protein